MHLVRSSETRDFWSVLWRKIKFQRETSFIFIFYCGTVLRETGEKMEALFTILFGIKNETG